MRADAAHTRFRFVALALGAIALGLIIHRRGDALPPAVRDVVGDALWAAMVAWWIGAVAPTATLWRRATVALACCYAVEFSQLIHTPALDAFRRTTPGHLLLGSGFDPRDLLAYLAGVLTAMVIERALRNPIPPDPV